MAYYDYNILKEKKIAIGWLDITSKIKDTTALSLTKNITEYWVQENSNYDLKTCCFDNVDSILDWTNNYDINYLIVLATGNTLSYKNNLFRELCKFLDKNKDCVLFGHILDKKEKYYELHHQCFIVDISWWKTNGKPNFGSEDNIPWKTLEPIRSLENWHDDYTPHWIEPGNEIKNYTGKRQGWHLINHALRTTGKICSFDEIIRESKYYLYPEVENEFHNKNYIVLDSLQSYVHYIANTESPPPKINAEVNGVICTASGITPLLCSYSASLKPHSKVTVFDYSPVALVIQKKIITSNFNFRNFKKSFYDIIKDEEVLNLLRADSNIEKMQDIINALLSEGLEDFIERVWPTLKFNYKVVNMLNIHDFKRVLLSHKNEPTLIHLTNILHYQNTSWIYGAKHRYRIEKEILDLFLKHGKDKYYIYQNRPGKNSNWRYLTPDDILNNQDRYLSPIKELEILPWMK